MSSVPCLHTHINSDNEIVLATYTGSEFGIIKFRGDCYSLKINSKFPIASEKCEHAELGFMDIEAVQYYAYALYIDQCVMEECLKANLISSS